MKPNEFIDFAGNLAVQAATSAPKSRTVVSRAYYGAFHLAGEFLVRMGKAHTDRHDALFDHRWRSAATTTRALRQIVLCYR